MNRLLVGIPDPVKGELPKVHDTGLELMPWCDDFILPIGNDMVADEIARLVAGGIKREFGEVVAIDWSEE